jgi:glycosyltransferase 2 family protein
MNIKFWVGIIISLVLVVIIIYQVDLAQVAIALKSANYFLILPSIILVILTIIIRAFRWQYLLKPVKTVRMYSLFSATSIGFMANMILPARLGELIRAYLIGQREDISKSASLATIVVERLWDILILILFLGLVLLVTPLAAGDPSLEEGLKWGGGISLFALFAMLLSLVFLKEKTKASLNIVQTIMNPLSANLSLKVENFISSFAAGLGTIKGNKDLIYIAIWSFILWVLSALSLHIIFFAFHIYIPFYAPFFLIVLQAFGVALPSSPGFIGTYHAATIAGLTLLGIPKEQALSIAIVMHASFFFPTILLGMYLLWLEGLSFAHIRNISRS